MKDSDGKHIIVSTEGDGGPYVIVPPQDVERVKGCLDQGGYGYSVYRGAVRLNKTPVLDGVNLGQNVDPVAVQGHLDSCD
jgi:hypothetical protein